MSRIDKLFNRLLEKEDMGDFLSPRKKEEVNQTESGKTNDYYWNMFDPSTGERFDIPLLDQSAGSFYWDYIYYMKIKETKPESFAKIMGWN